jgi:Xaa-Pro aminopeptidase
MNLLIFGDTDRSPALRHEVPVGISDPFLYLEVDGRRSVVTNALEDQRIAAVAPDIERLSDEGLGKDELIAAGRSGLELEWELCLRAIQELGINDAVVPPEFPLALADRLRHSGIALIPNEELFVERRRRKTSAELAGIRRAADAAMAAIAGAAAMLREATIRGDELWLDGELLSSERVRERMRDICSRAGAPAPSDITVKPMGPHPDIGHAPGSGRLPAHTPIELDLWPQDEESGCWADMTRTFVRGEISGEIASLHELVLEAHTQSCGGVRAGVSSRSVYDAACDVFEAAGQPTLRTKPPGETLREGFFFALGHGVGLEIHEAPSFGRSSHEELLAGDVIAVEPGLVVSDLGGTRVEDLLLVTDTGSENLTRECPYELTP